MIRLSKRTGRPVRVYRSKKRHDLYPPKQLPITHQTRFVVSQRKSGKIYEYYKPCYGSISFQDLENCYFYDYDIGNYAAFPVAGAVMSNGKTCFGKIYQYLNIFYDTRGTKWIEKFDRKGISIIKMVLKDE